MLNQKPFVNLSSTFDKQIRQMDDAIYVTLTLSAFGTVINNKNIEYTMMIQSAELLEIPDFE